jgi:hypothetical protein
LTQTTSPANAISFGGVKVLSDTPGSPGEPQIEASGSNVYTVWGGTGDVFFRKSSDAGNTFQNAIQLSTGNGAERPLVAKAGSNVYVVWTASGDVFFKRSTDSGASFGSTVNLSNDDDFSNSPQVAVDGNNVYVVWVSAVTEEGKQLFFKASIDGGASFGSTKKIDKIWEFLHPAIAASGNNVYIAFAAGGGDHQAVFFTKSTDKGNSFSNTNAITNNLQEVASLGDMAAKGSNVYIVWSDHFRGRVSFIRSTDNGASFGSTKDFGSGSNPQLDIISNNVYVVWQGNDGISFKASTNNGASFGSTKILSNSFGDDPQISSSGTAVRVVWSESVSGNNEIMFRASGSEGSSFGSAKNLSNNSGDSVQPQIISSGGNVYVVWSDNTDSPDSPDHNYRTFFKGGVD